MYRAFGQLDEGAIFTIIISLTVVKQRGLTVTDKTAQRLNPGTLPEHIAAELDDYEKWIKDFKSGKVGDIKMQKIRLQLGTYAQRQEGVQMERIKFPGGVIKADQLEMVADCCDRYGSGVIHFTTREDAQLYYLKLEEVPNLLRDLASVGITTREACGNTVRNITASYRTGMSPHEPFDVKPYAEALYAFLVRNKFNQVMGRKFKIAFESTDVDYSGMLIHDLGFQAVTREENGTVRRGFRVYIGGGLGGIPALGRLCEEFLPDEELLAFTAATVRIFDRLGERRNRMQARMKFLVKKMGWEPFKAALDAERPKIILDPSANNYLIEARQPQVAPKVPNDLPANPEGVEENTAYQAWLNDNVEDHKFQDFKGINIRLRLGDLDTEKARSVADLARIFSQDELRITIEQNLFFPWVPASHLGALYQALSDLGLSDAGAETMADTTTCPGADTCRLGITSAKGLGASIDVAMSEALSKFKELTQALRVKVSGCPNNCAQHGVANIGFQGAALKVEGKTVPAHELFVGGGMDFENSTIGFRVGKFPAKNGPKVVEKLLEVYLAQKQGDENFNATMLRLGKENLLAELKPLTEVPSYEVSPEFFQDWGHANEKFVTRGGIKGECAGAPVQEKVPVIQQAKERLSQAEALIAHNEFDNAQIEAYESMAAAARVPLYKALVDPFTPGQTLWEFENIFARAGRASEEWIDSASQIEAARHEAPTSATVQAFIDLARRYIDECERVYDAMVLAEAKPA